MPVDNWDEIRTAFQVAKMGTVSGAAQVLGVHHATVIRHIDALEEKLGVKLFQRHARGYTPTEAGEDLLKVGQATDDQFAQLASRIRGRGETVSGELVITTLSGASEIMTQVIAGFQALHPEITVRYLAGERLFRLEYGEAHIAIRAGKPPQEPDNVVQPFHVHPIALYVSQKYVDYFGLPAPERLWQDLRFIAHDDPNSRAPFLQWLRETVPDARIVFTSTEIDAINQAVIAGVGASFLPVWFARGRDDLIEVAPARPEWESANWLVTHVDLHRTPKVQAFLDYLKTAAKDWPCAK